jgi:ribonuclease HI
VVMEESSFTDPRGRGLFGINNRTHTPKGHKAYGESPSTPDRQPSAASDPAYNERGRAGLAIERDHSSLQRESEIKRFGRTARESRVDSTPWLDQS